MRISSDSREFQLQLWNGREYETAETGERDALEASFERHAGTRRRIVLTEKNRPARPKYSRGRSIVSDRTKDTIIADYVAWAQRAGLQRITCYRQTNRPQRWLLATRLVDIKDFLGDAPAPDVEVKAAA